jgi:RNA polymerase sigma-70 factor, ECF subfamily
VRIALRMLTLEQRQVIGLRFYENWENEEVSAAVQKPVGAVRALQHRALGALRLWLLKDSKREEPNEFENGI